MLSFLSKLTGLKNLQSRVGEARRPPELPDIPFLALYDDLAKGFIVDDLNNNRYVVLG